MDLIKNAELHVIALLSEKLPSTSVYHNISHTRRVVNNMKELVDAEKIEGEDALILQLAAWFHDTGFIEGHDNHEKKSIEIMRSFLKSIKADENVISGVEACILATIHGKSPKNEIEKIMIDADCGHLGKKSYTDITGLLREEWEQQGIKVFTDKEWIQENIKFFTQEHQFYTNHAIMNWQPTKDKNLAQLYKSLKKLNLESQKTKIKSEELKLKKKKARTPERGIETMFRVTLRNHITLSNIADTKANILLSVNAIIISLALSNLIPKLDNPSNNYLIIPTMIFVVFSLVSMALSVLATRPNVTSGKFTKDDVANKKVNLLFFGNFHKMKLQDFEWAIGEVMKDKDYLYSSMTKDLYFLGLVLHKKYKILRITYTIFLIGIVISVLSFGISFKLLNI